MTRPLKLLVACLSHPKASARNLAALALTDHLAPHELVAVLTRQRGVELNQQLIRALDHIIAYAKQQLAETKS